MNNLTSTTNIIKENNKEQVATAFLHSIDIAETTRRNYKQCLKTFIDYLNTENIESIDHKAIIDYKNYLLKKYTDGATINLHIATLKRFYKYLVYHYGIKDYTAELHQVKVSSEHKKDSLNITQARELIDTANTPREKAIIYLLLTGALRTIELIRADIKDLTIKGNNYILQVQGKGHQTKDDYIIITASTYKAINEYLATRKNTKPTDPLFTSNSNRNNNGRLTTRSIRRLIKEHLQKIGINTPKITTHSLRHTAITQAIMNGADLMQAQKLARHKNPATTNIYISETADQHTKEKTATILDNVFFN